MFKGGPNMICKSQLQQNTEPNSENWCHYAPMRKSKSYWKGILTTPQNRSASCVKVLVMRKIQTQDSHWDKPTAGGKPVDLVKAFRSYSGHQVFSLIVENCIQVFREASHTRRMSIKRTPRRWFQVPFQEVVPKLASGELEQWNKGDFFGAL